MKKNRFYSLSNAYRAKEIEDNFVMPVLDDQDIQDKHDPKDSFLSIVYSIDERTKLPTGDLNYLVSDKANPEVKQWILQNLMMDVSASAMPAAPKGLSDDDIASLARDPKEDVRSYMNRVNQYAKANVEFIKRISDDARKSMESQVDVSSPGESTSVSSE